MKTKLLFSVLFLLLGTCSFAQFTTVGSKWDFGVVSFGSIHFHKVYLADSTVIMAGDTFTRIASPSGEYYVMEDSSRVWYLKGSKKYLLFDRKVQQGDTLTVDASFSSGTHDTTQSLLLTIDSVYYLQDNMLNSQDSLKVWKFTDHSGFANSSNYDSTGYFTDKVLQTFGSAYLNLDELFLAMTTDVYTYLRCFSSPAYNYRTTTFGGLACDYVSGTAEVNPSEITMSIYPNPTTSAITIEAVNKTFQSVSLFDVSGRKIKDLVFTQPQSSCKLDLSGLSPGFYFCSVSNAENTWQYKLLLQPQN